jgi:Ca2+-binding RTX toxin-like protein
MGRIAVRCGVPRGGFLGVAIASLGLSIGVATPALALTTCGFSAPVVTVTLNANGDDALVDVAAGAIRVNGVACQGATVTNADTINISTDNIAHADDNIVTISHAGGKFQPGLTLEGGGGISEIEFQIDLGNGLDELHFIGTSANDNVVLGAGGGTSAINLNANETTDDVDVRFDAGVDLVTLSGGNGSDQLRGSGGAATGAAYNTFLTLLGGTGNDTLFGGNARDIIVGGRGADSVLAGGHDDSINGGDGPDFVIGGWGNDTILGKAGVDRLYGGADSDRITGGPGHDEMYGQAGIDVLHADDGQQDVVDGGNPITPNGDTCVVDQIDSVNSCEQ